MTNLKSRKTKGASKSRSAGNTGVHVRLACPFQARQPEKDTKAGSCAGLGFKTSARLIEHIKKHHGPLGEATSAVPGSPEIEPVQHITVDQLEEIKALPRLYDPVAKWERVYRIIFGTDVDMPSPHVLSAEKVLQYALEAPQWLLDGLSEHFTDSMSPTPNEEVGYRVAKDFLQAVPYFLHLVRHGPSNSESSIPPSPESSPQISDSASSTRDIPAQAVSVAGCHMTDIELLPDPFIVGGSLFNDSALDLFVFEQDSDSLTTMAID